MIERSAAEALRRLASQFPVIGITGPRQSGKTTLAKMVFPDKRYVSFDDKQMREFAQADSKDFLLAFPDGAIIDEAQKVPDIFDAVKYNVDNYGFVPGKYILTGSSQFKLRKNMADSMAGRVAFLKLLPFSVAELNRAGRLPQDAYSFMFSGQYPPLYDEAKHFIREDWYENYIESYIELDVREQINAQNVSVFSRFLQLCALYSGQIVSMSEIAKSLEISAPTVKSWLSILESSYIIHFLEADSNNLGKSLIKSPKLYFADTGLLCYLLRISTKEELVLSRYKGAVVETLAVAELLKSRTNAAQKPNLTYYRDKQGFEVDVVADWKHSFAIEVKSDSRSEKKLSSSVKRYAAMRTDTQTLPAVCYLGDLSCEIDGVKYVSWRDWGSIIQK